MYELDGTVVDKDLKTDWMEIVPILKIWLVMGWSMEVI
jgi:hypothetical protein